MIPIVHRSIEHKLDIPKDFVTSRLDQAVAELLPQYSRALIQQWIKQGALLVDKKSVKASLKLVGGERILIKSVIEDVTLAQPEFIPIDVVFEDAHFLVVNKPAGLVVHPGAGNTSGTLMNALLNYDENLKAVPRAGIIHRLDKNTSGLLIVARNIESQFKLVKDLESRTIKRSYAAIVYGTPPYRAGEVDLALGRHPKERKKVAVRVDGKSARTNYIVTEKFEGHSLLGCELDTGRTHQIRVHMQALGNPIVGDIEYGGQYRRSKSDGPKLEEILKAFPRQALHARKLVLNHPKNGKNLTFRAPIPVDFQNLLEAMRGAD